MVLGIRSEKSVGITGAIELRFQLRHRQVNTQSCMDTPASRLKSSRIKKGFSSASEAARYFGWKPSSYIAHENGQNDMRALVAKTYASAFGVDLNWLIFGTGSDTVVLQTETLGDLIREERTQRGWSQAQLGERLDVTPQVVNQWEKNQALPSVEMLRAISNLLGIASNRSLVDPAGPSGHSLNAEQANRRSRVDPVLLATWERMTHKQRRTLVQIAVLLSED
jgi:transcriptional regulator with XRE-family HTH domain